MNDSANKDISNEEIRDRVRQWAESSPEIKRVYLIGSRARGDSSPDSDVDLAVEVVGILGEDAYTRYHYNHKGWKDDLKLALGRPVDIVRRTDNGKPDLQKDIERDKMLIYESPPE